MIEVPLTLKALFSVLLAIRSTWHGCMSQYLVYTSDGIQHQRLMVQFPLSPFYLKKMTGQQQQGVTIIMGLKTGADQNVPEWCASSSNCSCTCLTKVRSSGTVLKHLQRASVIPSAMASLMQDNTVSCTTCQDFGIKPSTDQLQEKHISADALRHVSCLQRQLCTQLL